MGKIIMNGNAYGSVGSDVEANPQGTATDTLNTIGIDNVIYEIQGGESMLVDGALDENNLLYESVEQTNFTQNAITYTATKDCYAFCTFQGSSSTNMTVILNNVLLTAFMTLNTRTYRMIPLKKGDVISSRHTSDNEECYFKMVVYGRKPASEISAPVIYSTEEREVGVWADDKPLYQKTLIDTTALAGTSKVIDISSLDVEFVDVISCELVDNGGNYSPITWFNGDNQYYAYINIIGNNQIEIGYSSQIAVNRGSNGYIMTIQYTKTTDTAGSGSYNTLGVPKVHYSTSEQVIGTDYDGKPIYQKTYTNLGTINSSTNIDLQLSNISWITVDPANSNLSNCIPFPYIHPNTNNVVGCFFDMNGGSPIINCRAGSDASGTFTLDKLTVRYKKTTD